MCFVTMLLSAKAVNLPSIDMLLTIFCKPHLVRVHLMLSKIKLYICVVMNTLS